MSSQPEKALANSASTRAKVIGCISANEEVFLLLCGGDRKSQSKDIAEAHRIWKAMEDEA